MSSVFSYNHLQGVLEGLRKLGGDIGLWRAISGVCNGGLHYFWSGCSVGRAVGCGVFGAGSGFRPG